MFAIINEDGNYAIHLQVWLKLDTFSNHNDISSWPASIPAPL